MWETPAKMCKCLEVAWAMGTNKETIFRRNKHEVLNLCLKQSTRWIKYAGYFVLGSMRVIGKLEGWEKIQSDIYKNKLLPIEKTGTRLRQKS